MFYFQATKFIDAYSGTEDDQHPATTVLTRLKQAIEKLPTIKCREALEELRDILIESDISPFEVNYSGLIKALLNYIADPYGPIEREQRLRVLLNVFSNCPLDANAIAAGELNSGWMSALVTKLNGCVSQLEQFPVKVHDLPASTGNGRGGTSALKFFNTHQLKVNFLYMKISHMYTSTDDIKINFLFLKFLFSLQIRMAIIFIELSCLTRA